MYDEPQRQMTWLSDGRILRGGGNYSILRQLGVANGAVTTLAEGEEAHNTPVLLPNGSLLLTILRGGFQSSRNSVGVWAPGASQAAELVTNATSPQLVGRAATTLRAIVTSPWDARQREVGLWLRLRVEEQQWIRLPARGSRT